MRQSQTQATTNSTLNSETLLIPDDVDLVEDEIDQEIAAEIMEDWDGNRALVEEYRKSKRGICVTKTNVHLIQVEKLLYPTLRDFLVKLIHRVIDEDCFYKPRTCFNGIDYLSECLYNTNLKYPERKDPWVHIFDMDWVNNYLQEHPRPFFPLSLLTSQVTAAKYIQAHMRGYWVRKRADLQEIRTFWKTIKFKRDGSGRLSITLLDGKKSLQSKNKLPKKTDTITNVSSNPGI